MSGADTFDLQNEISGDQLAYEIASQYDEWVGLAYEARKQWTDVRNYVYATDTSHTENNLNPWSNSTIRPKLANIYDNLTVNYQYALFPNDDWLTFVGHDEDSSLAVKRKIVEDYLKTKHQLSNFYEVTKELLNDWVLTGNCFCSVSYSNNQTSDPLTGEDVVAYTGPVINRISPYDIVFNPRATNFEKSPKIIRILKTEGELFNDVNESPEASYAADALALIQKDRGIIKSLTEDDINKSMSFIPDGFSSPSEYYNSGCVELLEFYGDIYDPETGEMLKNYVVTIADGRYILRKQPLSTWSGRPHIYHAGWRSRPDNIWAQGPLENLLGLQYRINHLENARADAFDQMLDPDWLFIGDPEITQVGAARHIFVSENGGAQPIAPDSTVLNADFQIRELESLMEVYAGAPREAMGIRTPGEKTAFEVDKLANAASRMFEHKANEFSKFLEKIANAEIEVARRNLNGTDIVMTTDNDYGAQEFMSITRSDITSNGTLVAVGSRHFARQQQLASSLMQMTQFFADPEIKQHFSSIKMAEKIADYMGESATGFMQPYVRIPEQAEAMKLANVAQRQVQEDDLVPIDQEMPPEMSPEMMQGIA